MRTASGERPHLRAETLERGSALAGARAAVILLHGRGATAGEILALSDDLQYPGFAFLAPQADNGAWYPKTFLAPREQNEPWLTGALEAVDRVVHRVQDAGIGTERTILLGFSQGACLAVEYAVRNPRFYGGIACLSGGLVGDVLASSYRGDLESSLVFLACGDSDVDVPKERVRGTADVLRDLGGEVVLTFYPGIGHAINEEEIAFVRKMMRSAAS